MFFKPNKRRNTCKSNVNAAYCSVETLDAKILMSATNGDAQTTTNATNDPVVSIHVNNDDQLVIRGTGLHDDVTVNRFDIFGLSFLNVNATSTDASGNEYSTSFSVDTASVESIVFYGLSGNDRFENRSNIASRADGGFGNDTLIGGSGEDVLSGGADNDALSGDYVGDFGGSSDTLRGGSGNDVISGGGGNDFLYGDFGDDTLRGNSGNDRLYGDDVLFGNYGWFGGDDILEGGLGDDFLYGFGGADNLHGEGGNDYLSGGNGNDNLYGDKATDNYLAGEDTLYGGNGNDYLFGYERNDYLNGGSGVDILSGGDDNDRLFGGQGLDVLNGDAGNDYLDGGNDGTTDVLRGGAGADTFVRHFNLFGPNVYDSIQDLEEIDWIFTRWHLHM